MARLVQVEATERLAVAAAEATQLDLGSVVQQLQALVAGREAAAAAEAAAPAAPGVGLAELAAAELEGRLAIMQTEHGVAMQQQQERLEWAQTRLERHARCLEVERQEGVARLEVAAEQAAGLAALAGQLAAVAGQLAEARAAAQASREQVASLEEALEEREAVVSQLGRDLEALQDAQAASDAAGQQRELGHSEAERRAGIVAEHRAAWSTLQEMARASQAGEMRQARVPLMPSLPPTSPIPC